MKDFFKGDTVITPDPNDTDTYSHSFIGTIIDTDIYSVIVEDSEGECFEIEKFRLIKVDEEYEASEQVAIETLKEMKKNGRL